MKITRLFLVVLFGISIAAYGGERYSSVQDTNATVANNGTTTDTSRNFRHERHPKGPPLKPYPRLLPLKLNAPGMAQMGIPLVGVSVNLRNPGTSAPNARLRLIIHDKDRGQTGEHRELSTDTVKIEVLEGGYWKPVLLSMVDKSVMGTIGFEGVTAHRARQKRGGFAIPAGLKKTWQLRMTFSLPGTYSLVAAVSPDNGSRHLARPAHSVIVVE